MNRLTSNIINEFKKGNALHKIIYINIAFFLLIKITESILFLSELNTPILDKLFLPADINILKTQPWSFISFMFIHKDFWHLFLNMIFLYYIGNIFLKWISEKELIYVYILGGLFGCLTFLLSYNYIPILKPNISNGVGYGASASIFSIMIAIATYKPTHKIQIPFIGSVYLTNFTFFLIILSLISLKDSTGGSISHLGGGIFGFLYIKKIKSRQKTSNLNQILNKLNIFKSSNHKRKYTDDYLFNKHKANQNKKIDLILEKIAKSGYKSLSKNEKDLLFNASKK